MTSVKLRNVLAVALAAGAAGACSRPAAPPRTVGPIIGESTAAGPSDPTVPPPDAAGVTETSGRISGTPSPVANPAPTVDTMPSTTGQNQNPTDQPVIVAPGVTSGPAPVGAGASATSPTGPNTGAAGPNGPGTGNGRPTPTAPQTPGSPSQPVTPPPRNDTGPGTGNAPLNPPPATTPAPVPQPAAPPVTPR